MNLLYPGFGEEGAGRQVIVNGKFYNINYEYYYILKILSAMHDQSLSVYDQIHIIINYFYKDAVPSDIKAAIIAMTDFIDKGNYHSGKKFKSGESGKQYYDYSQDSQIIFASMCQAYGESWYHWHWWRWKAAFDNLPGDTPIKEIINIRARKITSKMLSEEKKNLQELKQIYALKKSEQSLMSAKELEASLLKATK